MPQSRQLAAIMFTDIVGYSATMQQDETAAVEKINRFRQTLEARVSAFNGKIIQYYGDGCLLLFNSSVDAVGLAKKLQEDFNTAPVLPVRIGIHIGDVLLKDENVFGDAVNIASRIQALAPAGGILISEAVQKNIANKHGIATEFVKTETLKNIKDPFRIYSVKTENINTAPATPVSSPKKRGLLNNTFLYISLGIVFVFLTGYFVYNSFRSNGTKVNAAQNKEPQIESIAVLPFTDNSATHDQEYLGNGIAEEILNVLNTTVKDLKVTGRTSSFALKDSSLKVIGRILNVKSVLEGSVQKVENQVKVIVRLLNVEDGSIIWTEPFDRKFKDLFSLQNEIAANVGEKLKLTFENNVSPDSATVNPLAYELVLKGNYYFNKGPEGYREAGGYYKKAITIDSSYSYAYIRQGWAIYQLTLSGQYPSKTGFAMVRKEIEKAQDLKLTAAEKISVHHLLAFINLWGYNWKTASAEYEKAFAIIQKTDVFSPWHQSLALGKTAEAVSIFKKISDEIYPEDFLKLRDLAILQYFARQFAEAIQTCDRILELAPSFSEAFRIKGNIFSAQNRPDSALKYFNRAAQLGNDWGRLLTLTILPQVMKKEEAKKVFLVADSLNPAAIPAMARALIYHSFGENDKAFEWLNKSYEQKDFWLASLRVDPMWDPMRADPRFQKLMKKMNFPD